MGSLSYWQKGVVGRSSFFPRSAEGGRQAGKGKKHKKGGEGNKRERSFVLLEQMRRGEKSRFPEAMMFGQKRGRRRES